VPSASRSRTRATLCASTSTRPASPRCATPRRPTGGRFIELAPSDTSVIITLEPAASNVTRGAIGIRFTTDDADDAHAAFTAAGVDTDEILRWPGVPAMFSFRDPDGNAFSVTEVP
jgi:lactoylglutathione lyase